MNRSQETALFKKASKILRAVAHPLRLTIVSELNKNERTVTELQKITGRQQAIVSQQLAVLRRNQIVGHRREGRTIHYYLCEPRIPMLLECIRKHK